MSSLPLYQPARLERNQIVEVFAYQILILHTQLVAHTSPPCHLHKIITGLLGAAHIQTDITPPWESLGSDREISGKNVLGNLWVDILKFLHCLGIGNNHRVVLWLGLLFCLWLFPLSGLCGDVVITSRAQHSQPTFMLEIKYNADTQLLSSLSYIDSKQI